MVSSSFSRCTSYWTEGPMAIRPMAKIVIIPISAIIVAPRSDFALLSFASLLTGSVGGLFRSRRSRNGLAISGVEHQESGVRGQNGKRSILPIFRFVIIVVV